MTTEERMSDLQLEAEATDKDVVFAIAAAVAVAEAKTKAAAEAKTKAAALARARLKADAERRARLKVKTKPFWDNINIPSLRMHDSVPKPVSLLSYPDAVQKQGTSVVTIPVQDDDGYSTPTIEDYESPPLPATDSDDFSASPIRSISSSQADPDDIDSDNAHSKIEQVIQQVPGTHRDDIIKRVRSIRLKYNIPWNAAAEILFFRLIKSALKVQHSSEGEFKEYIENMLINWKDTLKYFLPNRFSEVEALNELENACLKAKQSFSVFPMILSCLYEHNILSQRTIVYWVQDAGRKYGPNETLVKESSEFIKTLKEGLCNDDNQIPLYGSEDVYEGHGFDDQVDDSE